MNAAAQNRALMRFGYFTFALYMLTFFTIAHAGDGDFVWTDHFGGDGSTNPYLVSTDAYGDIFTVGTFAGSVDFDPGPFSEIRTASTFYDIYVSKLGSSGDLEWAKQIRRRYDLSPICTTLDNSGCVLLAGKLEGEIDFDSSTDSDNLIPENSHSIFFAKIDGFSRFLWGIQVAQTAYATNLLEPRRIVSGQSGNFILLGEFKGAIDLDPGPGLGILTNSESESAYFIAKYDSSGDYIWSKMLYGVWSLAAATDQSGGLVLAGYVRGTADIDPGPGTYTITNYNGNSLFIEKLDVNGDFVSAGEIRASVNSSGVATAIVLDEDENIYCAGSFRGTYDFDSGAAVVGRTSNGVNSLFVLKLSNSGEFRWVSCATGGWDSVTLNAIGLDKLGNVYSCGTLSGRRDFDPGPEFAYLTSLTAEDIFAWKLDALGNYVWAKQYGCENNAPHPSICVSDGGDVLVLASFKGTVDFDPGPDASYLTSLGHWDTFLTKLSGEMPAPIITLPNGGKDYSTSLTSAIRISGICSTRTNEIHINSSASGVSYVPGGSTWSFASGPLTLGINRFAATAISPIGESGPDTLTIEVNSSPPNVESIATMDANPTNESVVTFRVRFDEFVTHVDAGDFTVSATGPSGTSILGVLGTGDEYLVSVNTGSGEGLLWLDAVDNDSVQDLSGVSLGGEGTHNGEYTLGEEYIIDRTGPTVSLTGLDSRPTNGPITVRATFSEPVTDFRAEDIVTTNATLSNFSAFEARWKVSQFSFTIAPQESGEFTWTIPDSVAHDVAGNPNIGASVTRVCDLVPPVISLLGDDPMHVELNSVFSDPGATAFDNLDGDITDDIGRNIIVDTSYVGVYRVNYWVRDAAGNRAMTFRTVYVDEPLSIPLSSIPIIIALVLIGVIECFRNYRWSSDHDR